MAITKRYIPLLLLGALFLLVPLTAQAQFNTNWEFSAAQGDNPSYIGTDNDARGIAYGMVDDGNGNMVERVFVAIGGNNPYEIKILNASDGTDTGNTLSGVSSLPGPSNGRKLNDISVTPGGIIIACNAPNNPFLGGGTQNFKCWRWDSLTDSPTNIIDYAPPDNSGDGVGDWVGRQFSIAGTASDNSLTLLTAAARNSPYVYRFTTSDNGQSFAAEAIERGGRPPSGNLVGIAPEAPGASSFFFNEGGTQPLVYASDGSEQGQDPGIFSNFSWALKYFEVGTQEWLTTFNWEGSGSGQFAELANITNGLSQPSLYGTTPSLGSNTNTNGTGDLAVRVNGDNTATLYVLATNNGIGSYTTTNALPVEMASFQAATRGEGVQLTWTTTAETNNAGFRVQRQVEDGSWTQLGFVESKADGGTTSNAQQYRFAVEGGLAPGTHRFRLEQVDLDGTTHLSDVVSAEVQMQSALKLTAPSPHPVTGPATLSFSVKDGSEATVHLYNVLGQKVRTLYSGTPPAGQSQTVRLSTDDLASGTYLLRLQASGATKTAKMTVVR